MRYLKMLGLAAVAAAALTAFVGSGVASANTVLCHTLLMSGCAAANWDWPAGTNLKMSVPTGSTPRFRDTSGTVTYNTCTGGEISGTVETTTTPTGKVPAANMTWENCTRKTKTLTGGSLQIHHSPGSYHGIVKAKDFVVTIEFFGMTCAYGLGSTYKEIGKFISSETGLQGILPVNVVVALQPAHSDEGCVSSGRWDTAYEQTTKTVLYVAEN